MYDLIQKVLSSMWKNKKIIFLFLLFTFFIFILRFPWNQSVEKIVRLSQKNLPTNFQFEEVNLDLFPPGISFHNFSVNHKMFNQPFSLDRLSVSLALGHWLFFNKGFKFKGRKERSILTVVFSTKDKKRDGETFSHISLESFSSFLDLQILAPLFESLRLKGFLIFNAEFKGSLADLEYAKGKLFVKGNQVEILSSQIQTKMGDIKLPHLKWSQAKAQFKLKDGQVLIESLVLGSDRNDLHVRLKGQIELFYSYNQIRFNAYDFQTRIELAPGVDFKFIDLMLAKTKEIQNNRSIYKARISGQGNKPPNIETLKDF